MSNLRKVGEKPRKKANPQTTGNTEGRVMVKTSRPDEGHSRDDFVPGSQEGKPSGSYRWLK